MTRELIEINGRQFIKVEMTAKEHENEYDYTPDERADGFIWLEDKDRGPSDIVLSVFSFGEYEAIYPGRGRWGIFSSLDKALELVAEYM